MTQPRTQPQTTPRWPTLLALGAGVLALHVVLLAGGLPDFTAQGASAAAHIEPLAAHAPGETTATPADAHPAAPPVRIGTVRWIVPTPTAQPAPIQAAKPAPTVQAPVRIAAAKPAAPVETPVLEPVPEPLLEATPPPAEETAAAPLPDETTVLAQTAPALPEEPPAKPASKPLPPAQPPASARLQYAVTGKVKGFSYSATGTLDWELAEGRYTARMEMRMPLLGSRVQTSTGRVGPEGLMPERFADKGRSERAAHFEREQHRIRFSANTPEAELLPGAQDRLSLFLQIAGLLQARPQAYASGQVIDMQVAGTGDAEIWRFQVGEETTLALPAGELRVRHLLRQPRKEFDSTVEMWLAPDLNHLPVRLRVTQANGDLADQQLSEKP